MRRHALDNGRSAGRLAWRCRFASPRSYRFPRYSCLSCPSRGPRPAGSSISSPAWSSSERPSSFFIVTPDRVAWFKRHLWLVGLTILVVLGVAFALGPVQLLRLIRLIGALRILRTGRIIKAGRLLAGRGSGFWNKFTATGVSVLVAVFVAATLADPTSTV